METCVANKASAAVVQRVPPAAVEQFKQWQHDVAAAAETFAGYQGTDLYPPSGQGDEWVAVIHFDDDETLRRWLDSPLRAQWVAKLRATVGEFELSTLKGGFSQWFAGVTRVAGTTPPAWKTALTVLFGLYPTVMVLMIFVTPYTSPLGLAFSMLIGNALSVSILQWIVMPTLTRVLTPWLEADPQRGKALTMGGLALLVVLLLIMAALFHPVTG